MVNLSIKFEASIFHCNYVGILNCFAHIISYFPKFEFTILAMLFVTSSASSIECNTITVVGNAEQ